MEKGRWVWDNECKQLKFERDTLLSIDLQSLEKFKHDYSYKLQLELSEQDRNRLVTLEDVKKVAIDQISKASLKRASVSTTKLFDCCYKTEMMDTLLWCVLRYYRNLLNYRIASADEGLDNEGTVGNKAREHLRDSKHKLDQSESDLSASYIMLISGLQLESSHHCLRGELRYSRTQLDQSFYEILYEFLMLTTWITFEYQDWEGIHKELGRLFRTPAFNRDIPLSGGSRYRNRKEHITSRVYDERPETGLLRQLKSPLVEVLFPSLLDSNSLGKPIPIIHCDKNVEKMGIIGDLYSNYIPESLKLRDEIILKRQEERSLNHVQENESEGEYDIDYSSQSEITVEST